MSKARYVAARVLSDHEQYRAISRDVVARMTQEQRLAICDILHELMAAKDEGLRIVAMLAFDRFGELHQDLAREVLSKGKR